MNIEIIYIVSETPSSYIFVARRCIMSYLEKHDLGNLQKVPVKLFKKASDIPTGVGEKKSAAVLFISEKGKPRPLKYVRILERQGGADILLASLWVRATPIDYNIISQSITLKTMFE